MPADSTEHSRVSIDVGQDSPRGDRMPADHSEHSTYAWADYLHCMDGLPDPVNLPASAPARASRTAVIPGLVLSAGVAACAVGLSQLPVAPFTLAGNRHPIDPVMLAIVLGMILANILRMPNGFQPGLKFAARRLLPVGVILLGARLDFMKIMQVGAVGLGLSLLTIVAGIAIFLLFIRWRWVSYRLGLLLGIGTGICGGTAIVAAAPVIDAREDEVTFGVATITLVGLLSMFLLPVAARVIDMSQDAFGVWAGLAIHQTPQVVAAGFAYGQTAGATATTVKLARVALLAPALIVIGWMAARRRAPGGGRGKVSFRGLFPMFLLGFLLMAMLHTIGWLPAITLHLPRGAVLAGGDYRFDLAAVCAAASTYLIIAAMAAVGLETRLSALRQTGVRPLLLSLVAAGVIAAALGFALPRLGW